MVVYKHTNPATPPTINHFFSGQLGKYHDAQSLDRIVSSIMDSHPNNVEVIDLPNLTFGYNGAATIASDGQLIDAARKQLKLYRIHGNNDCARHGIFIYGSPHSREWVPKHALVETVYRVLKNYGSDAYLTQLLDEVDIFYLPDCNPDGSMYSFHDSANFRKNRHVNGGAPEAYPYASAEDNSCTVDINRNYSVGFGFGSSSGTCSNEAYRGVGNHSEPETRNISWVVKQYPKIWTSIVCHSAGNTIFWPVAPNGAIPQLDSANAKSPNLDEILGGTTSQRSGWFNYIAQRARAAIYDHRSTILDQAEFSPGPTPGSPFGSGISTYEMYFNHTDNPHTDRDRKVRSTQWYEHPHKIYQFTFEMSAVGQRPAWSEADELVMEWANGILETVACTRELSQLNVFGPAPVASENWTSGDYVNKDRAGGWGSDWRVTGDCEMLTDKYCHNGSHTVRLMSSGRIERTVNLKGCSGAKLTFSWRASSWENGDQVNIKVDDGLGWKTVKTFVNGDDDFYYHNAEIDLSAFEHISDFRIAFEGNMSSSLDWFYIDNIVIKAFKGIAFDDFNSNGFTGGKGWTGNWLASGSAVSIDSQYPLEGSHCAYITNNGRMVRNVDLTGVINPQLVFSSRSVYFETGDKAYIKINDGSGEVIVAEITPEHCDKVYHQHIIDLASYKRSSNFEVIFEGAMNESLDHWYLDQIQIRGERAIAIDHFDSKDFNGGHGFNFAWSVTGAKITKQQPFAGEAAVQFSNNDSIERSVDLSGLSGRKLEFVAKVDQTFGINDEFRIKVDDGAGWTTIKTLTAINADGYYHSFSIDLSQYNPIANFKIAFESNINSSSSSVYVDQIQIV